MSNTPKWSVIRHVTLRAIAAPERPSGVLHLPNTTKGLLRHGAIEQDNPDAEPIITTSGRALLAQWDMQPGLRDDVTLPRRGSQW